MLSKYARWSNFDRKRALRFPISFGQITLLISLASCTILLFYIIVFDAGSVPFLFTRLRQTACSPTTEHNADSRFLGPYLRRFNAPYDAHIEFDEQYSLLEESHMADKSGFLRLREPSGRIGYHGVSMYHQLHCLKMLRDKIENKHPEHVHTNREVIDDQETPDHLIHCLDYISQAVVCSADDTVEPARIVELSDGYHIAVIDGARSVHHCRNSMALSKMVEDSESKPISVEELEPGITVGMLYGQNN